MSQKKDDKKPASTAITTYREARHDYEILESFEAGIVLVGCEVKSLRASLCSLSGSFAGFEKGGLYLLNAYIAPYDKGNRENPDSKRPRKLLLHQSQLLKMFSATREKGLVLIPLKMYFNNRGIVKVELAVARGKKHGDRRADIKDRESRRQIDRDIKNRNRK
jgi:SsrA-binding protein